MHQSADRPEIPTINPPTQLQQLSAPSFALVTFIL